MQSDNLVIFHILAIGFGWQLIMYHFPALPEDTRNIWQFFFSPLENLKVAGHLAKSVLSAK